MPERPDRLRIARAPLLLIAAALCVLGSPGRAAAVVAAAPVKKEEAKLKTTLPPNMEAKLARFLEKVKEAKRKLLKERMRKEIENIAKATGLNPDGVKTLESASQQVNDLCLDDWMNKMEELLRRELRQSAAAASQILDQMLGQPELYANQDAVFGYVRPSDQGAWTEALKRALTPEQTAAWQKIQTERLQAFQKEMGDFLKTMSDAAREQFTRSIAATAADVKRSLGLSKERAAELDQLAKSASDKSVADWRTRAEQMLLQWEDAPRRAVLKNRQFYMGPESNERPDRQSVWKEGLAKLLSADELKQLETAQEERRLRRIRVMGMLMVAEFDEKTAFTAIQRQRLQPLLTSMVNDESSLFSEDGPYSVAFSLQAFAAVGATAKEQEMKGILDPVQWRHWQEICSQKTPDEDPENDGAPEEETTAAGTKLQTVVEPEDLEGALSDFLYAKTVKEQRRLLASMTLKAEDAGRVAGLSPDAIGRLETAARGASDKWLGEWKSNADQWIRSIVRDATAQDVRQRLRSIESYQMPRDLNATPEKDILWAGAVKTELTAPQKAAWTVALEERSAYRNRTIALAVMSEFDRRIPMTTEQWAKLEPMIAGMVNDYAPEISSMFGSNNSTRWYMQPFSIFIPFAAVPEKDFKDILGKEPWERWAGDPEFANCRNYWTNIQQMHGIRVKMAK